MSKRLLDLKKTIIDSQSLKSLKLMFLLSAWHEVEDDEEGPAVDVEVRSPS